MLYLGYSLKDIQTWLGHSNYHFTADTYVHSGSGVHEQMANSFSEKLGILLPEALLSADKLAECWKSVRKPLFFADATKR